MSTPAYPIVPLFVPGPLKDPQFPFSSCGKSLGHRVRLGFEFGSATHWLCDLEQIPWPGRIWCPSYTVLAPCRTAAVMCPLSPGPQ